MKLTAYKGRDIQMFIAMINLFEGEGITDIRVIRTRLESALRERLAGLRTKNRQIDQVATRAVGERCPECNSPEWYPGSADGVVYLACRVCRYSRVVG